MIYEFNGYKPVIHESAFVHPNATVTGNVIIGKDVYIGPGAAIRGDWGQIIIEDGCNVQENCTIHMFPGTTVLLKEAAHIGASVRRLVYVDHLAGVAALQPRRERGELR